MQHAQPGVLGSKSCEISLQHKDTKFAKSQGGHLDEQRQYQSWMIVLHCAPQPLELYVLLSFWLKNELLVNINRHYILGYLNFSNSLAF